MNASQRLFARIKKEIHTLLPTIAELSPEEKGEFDQKRKARNVQISVFLGLGASMYELATLVSHLIRQVSISGLDYVAPSLMVGFTLSYFLLIRHYSPESKHRFTLFFWTSWLLFSAFWDYSLFGSQTGGNTNTYTFACICLILILTLNKRDIFLCYSPSFLLLLGLMIYDPSWTDALLGRLVAALVIISGNLYWYRRRLSNFADKKTIEKQAAKLAKLDARKNDFIANISHEFRTPLTNILIPLKELSKESEKSQEVFQNMIQNGEHLLQLIHQLLELSKLEAGELQLSQTWEDARNILGTSASLFESQAHQKAISYSSHPLDQVVQLFVDRNKIEQVLINLLGNALKFTPDGGKVQLRTQLTETGEFVISIQDSGVGIPPEDLPYIFDRFYQVQSHSTRSYEGSGIGLAVCKEFVELHGGRIQVSSEEGAGSIFQLIFPSNIVHLPVETFEPLVATSANSVSKSTSPSDSTIQPNLKEEAKTILIAEDNTDLRKHLCQLLNQQGFQTVEAQNGEEAFSIAKAQLPDLLISDIMMPIWDGNQLCKHIKSDSLTCHIPIILLTAKAGFDQKLEGLSNHADVYLTKPFEPAELLMRVHNLIQLRERLKVHYGQHLFVQPKQIEISSVDELFLQNLIEIFEANIANPSLNGADLCDQLCVSKTQLNRKINALTDKSPMVYLRSFRLQRAYDLLQAGAGNASEVAAQVGFSSLTYFSREFKKEFNLSPRKLMQKRKSHNLEK